MDNRVEVRPQKFILTSLREGGPMGIQLEALGFVFIVHLDPEIRGIKVTWGSRSYGGEMVFEFNREYVFRGGTDVTQFFSHDPDDPAGLFYFSVDRMGRVIFENMGKDPLVVSQEGPRLDKEAWSDAEKVPAIGKASFPLDKPLLMGLDTYPMLCVRRGGEIYLVTLDGRKFRLEDGVKYHLGNRHEALEKKLDPLKGKSSGLLLGRIGIDGSHGSVMAQDGQIHISREFNMSAHISATSLEEADLAGAWEGVLADLFPVMPEGVEMWGNGNADNLLEAFHSFEIAGTPSIPVCMATCKGPYYLLNEDRMGVRQDEPGKARIVVVDGIGGGARGHQAANISVESLLGYDDIPRGISHASNRMGSDRRFEGGGAAFLSCEIEQIDENMKLKTYLMGDLQIAIGDPNQTRASIISRPQTLQRDWVDAGYTAEDRPVGVDLTYWHKAAEIVTKALTGSAQAFEAEYYEYEVVSGDWVIMASDGLFDVISPQECLDLILSDSAVQTPDQAMVKLSGVLNAIWTLRQDTTRALLMGDGFSEGEIDLILSKAGAKEDNVAVTVIRIP